MLQLFTQWKHNYPCDKFGYTVFKRKTLPSEFWSPSVACTT